MTDHVPREAQRVVFWIIVASKYGGVGSSYLLYLSLIDRLVNAGSCGWWTRIA
jgi:hypothetical protein